MDFYSAYAQGFARVAACTVPVAIADPAANAETILTEARACHDEGVAVAVFPELSLCGYAMDDLLLQDTLLEAVEPASPGSWPSRPTCCRCSWSARRWCTATASSTVRWSSTAARSSGSPRSPTCPNYREFYERRHFAAGDDRRWESIIGGRAQKCRSGRT